MFCCLQNIIVDPCLLPDVVVVVIVVVVVVVDCCFHCRLIVVIIFVVWVVVVSRLSSFWSLRGGFGDQTTKEYNDKHQ